MFQACAAADTAEELSAIIAADGARFLTKAGPKAHPCLKDRLAARAFVVKAIRTLGLDVEAVYPGPGRPGRGAIGWSWANEHEAHPITRGFRPQITAAAIAAYGGCDPGMVSAFVQRPRRIPARCSTIVTRRVLSVTGVTARKSKSTTRHVHGASPVLPWLEHARLLEELRLVLKPWQSGLSDFPGARGRAGGGSGEQAKQIQTPPGRRGIIVKILLPRCHQPFKPSASQLKEAVSEGPPRRSGCRRLSRPRRNNHGTMRSSCLAGIYLESRK